MSDPRILGHRKRQCPLKWAAIGALLAVAGGGCGHYMARRMAQAPNTFPEWYHPRSAPVVLAMDAHLVTNSPAQFAAVGPPPAWLQYRVVPPGDYGVKASSTNWIEGGERRFQFTFSASASPRPPGPARAPRGTIVLLHGYGLSAVSMAPWALRLAQENWQCVLVDLRGHGGSTGARVYFGKHEADDLGQLLDLLAGQAVLAGPVVAFGQSYGAALALRWQATDPRLHAVVAIAPYAELASVVLNLRREYGAWLPAAWVRAGLRKLPALLHAPAADFDPISWLRPDSVPVLFVAGEQDRIAPVDGVRRLYERAAPASQLLVVPDALHEPLPFLFEDLVAPVVAWLDRQTRAGIAGEVLSTAAPP